MPDNDFDSDFVLEELVLPEPETSPQPSFLDQDGNRLRTDLYEDTRDFTADKFAYLSWKQEDEREVWYVENPHKNRRKLTPIEFQANQDQRGDYRFPFTQLSNPDITAEVLRREADFLSQKYTHIRAIDASAGG